MPEVIYVCPECGLETSQPEGSDMAVCFQISRHKRRVARLMKRKEAT